MAIIGTGNFGKLLWPGLNKIYGKSYGEWKVEYTDLFDSFKSTKHYEEDLGVTSFGLATSNHLFILSNFSFISTNSLF